MLPPEVRATTFFAFNPKRLIVNPIKGTINGGFELVESIQYIACKVLDDFGAAKGEVFTKDELIRNGVVTTNFDNI